MRYFICELCRKRSADFLSSSLVGGKRICEKCSTPSISEPPPGGMKCTEANLRPFEMFFGQPASKLAKKFRTYADIERAAKEKGFVPWSGAEMPHETDKQKEIRLSRESDKRCRAMLNDLVEYKRIVV